MCMYVRTEGTVPQRPVSNRRGRPARLVQERLGRKVGTSGAVATRGSDPLAFLNGKIEDLPVTEEKFSSCFNLNIRSSYERLRSVTARFLKCLGKESCFVPVEKAGVVENLDNLQSWFEKEISELGLELQVTKHDPYDEDCGDIDFVVYSTCYELDMKVLIFIVSPVETLPTKAAGLYRQFIKFVSDSMSIRIGTSTDNYYLDMVMSYHDDLEQDIEELEGEDRMLLEERRKVIAAYKDGGEYDKLFEQIRRLSPESSESLKKRMEEYIKECNDADVCHLFKVLVDGLPLIKMMNINWFDFNPDVNGIKANDDSFIDVYSQQAILYSNNDGIEEALINALENDYNCGVLPVSYNIHMWLNDRQTEDDIREFMDNLDLGALFSRWMVDYYEASKKFDKIQEEDERI